MALTHKQHKSLDKHIDRILARQGREGHELSLFIRLAESRVYHGKPLHKALLKEVVFMRLTDLHESDTRIPKNTPWSGDYRKYEGWCYASQKYLANRVGSKDPSYCGEVLREIEADGFLRSRSYPKPGRGAERKKQYYPLDAAINAKIIELGVIENESDDNSDGEETPQGLNHSVAVVIPSRPQGLNDPARSGLFGKAQGLNPKEEALEYAPEVGELGRLLSPPLSGMDESTSLRSEEQKPKPKSKAIGVGVGGMQPETKPAMGLTAYLDPEPEEAAGRNPLKTSLAPDGYCPRCGGENGKHVNQPGMVCPVLKAKAAAAPRVFDVEDA